jgi:UDP-N-acetylmuramyl tripeptide synthase
VGHSRKSRRRDSPTLSILGAELAQTQEHLSKAYAAPKGMDWIDTPKFRVVIEVCHTAHSLEEATRLADEVGNRPFYISRELVSIERA